MNGKKIISGSISWIVAAVIISLIGYWIYESFIYPYQYESHLQVPENIRGLYIKTSDEIITGIEEPEKIYIDKNLIRLSHPNRESDSEYEITEAREWSNEMIFICKENKFRIRRNKSYFFIISIIVPTGYNDEEGEIELGKFHQNLSYLRIN